MVLSCSQLPASGPVSVQDGALTPIAQSLDGALNMEDTSHSRAYSYRHFIGIDPGADGGIFIFHESDETYEFFNTKEKKKAKVNGLKDALEIMSRLPPERTFIALEELHAIYGCSSTATFGLGKAFGFWQGIAMAFNFVVFLVPPMGWKEATNCVFPRPDYKLMSKITKTKAKKEHKKNLKELSIHQANKEFPELHTKHDGVADAANICLWLMSKVDSWVE